MGIQHETTSKTGERVGFWMFEQRLKRDWAHLFFYILLIWIPEMGCHLPRIHTYSYPFILWPGINSASSSRADTDRIVAEYITSIDSVCHGGCKPFHQTAANPRTQDRKGPYHPIWFPTFQLPQAEACFTSVDRMTEYAMDVRSKGMTAEWLEDGG